MGSIASAEVVGSCLAERHKPLVGASLFAEYSDVMNRDELFRDSHLDKAERDELLDIFLACCEWTEIYYGWRPNLRDENDNHLIELAVAGGAQCILLAIKTTPFMARVFSPIAALQKLDVAPLCLRFCALLSTKIHAP